VIIFKTFVPLSR